MRPAVFKGNIIVSNLPAEFTPADLADLFDQYGLVLGAKIDRWHDRPGGARGMVDLAPETSVDKAIRALNGQPLHSQPISVRRAPQKAKTSARPTNARPSPVGARPARPAPVAAGPMTMTKPVAAAPTRTVVVEYRSTPARRFNFQPPR